MKGCAPGSFSRLKGTAACGCSSCTGRADEAPHGSTAAVLDRRRRIPAAPVEESVSSLETRNLPRPRGREYRSASVSPPALAGARAAGVVSRLGGGTARRSAFRGAQAYNELSIPPMQGARLREDCCGRPQDLSENRDALCGALVGARAGQPRALLSLPPPLPHR